MNVFTRLSELFHINDGLSLDELQEKEDKKFYKEVSHPIENLRNLTPTTGKKGKQYVACFRAGTFPIVRKKILSGENILHLNDICADLGTVNQVERNSVLNAIDALKKKGILESTDQDEVYKVVR